MNPLLLQKLNCLMSWLRHSPTKKLFDAYYLNIYGNSAPGNLVDAYIKEVDELLTEEINRQREELNKSPEFDID